MTKKRLRSRGWLIAAALALVSATTRGAAPQGTPQGATETTPAPAASADAPKSRLVTNLWVDTDIRQVVQDIAAQTDTVVLCDQTVQGILSMSVKDMPLAECLERVCATGGYCYTKIKDYYLIGKAEPGTPLFQRLSEPQRVKLSNVLPDQVKTLLHPSLLPYVTFDKASGTVIVTAPEPMRHRILEAISQLDQPNSQVAIEAVVFELTDDGSKELALDWQFQTPHFSMSSVNLVQTMSYGEGTDLGVFVDATLRAIIESKKGQVLANPRILVMNNADAEIFIGQEKYFTLLSGQASNPYYTLQSIKAGVTLRVCPSIGNDGRITLGLDPEVSDVVTDDNGNTSGFNPNNNKSGVILPNFASPVVTRRNAKTTVAINDGETVLIGGLLRDQHRSVIDKVPGVGDVPGLGAPFRQVNDLRERQEVVLLISAHIMKNKNVSNDKLTSRLQQRYITPLDAIAAPPKRAIK